MGGMNQMNNHSAGSPFGFDAVTDPQHIRMFPELIEEGMSATFSSSESDGACIFAVGPTTVAAQFTVDESNRHPFMVQAALDERVPGWVGKGKDAIVVSYSGCTRRMIDAYNALKGKGCRIHCITSGGMLEELCKRDNFHLISLPEGMTPRSAVALEIGLISSLLKSLGAPYMHDALKRVLPSLKSYRDSLIADGSEVEGVAKAIKNKIPAIYSIVDSIASAKRWKLSLDEDTGAPAFYGEIPEFDHNEIVGWADPNIHARDLEMVILKINSGIPEFEYTMKSMLEVLEEYGRKVLCVDFPDQDITLAELKAMLFGDMVSLTVRE